MEKDIIGLIINLSIMYVIGSVVLVAAIDDIKVRVSILSLIVITLIVSLNFQVIAIGNRIENIEKWLVNGGR